MLTIFIMCILKTLLCKTFTAHPDYKFKLYYDGKIQCCRSLLTNKFQKLTCVGEQSKSSSFLKSHYTSADIVQLINNHLLLHFWQIFKPLLCSLSDRREPSSPHSPPPPQEPGKHAVQIMCLQLNERYLNKTFKKKMQSLAYMLYHLGGVYQQRIKQAAPESWNEHRKNSFLLIEACQMKS